MKNLTSLLLLISITATSHSQELINNFKTENRELIWQKVFDTRSSFQDLVGSLKTSGLVQNLEVADSTIIAEIKPVDADFKGAGFSEMLTPMYISRSHISGFLNIDFKASRYRVTIRKILLTQKYSDPLSKQGEITAIENYALKRGTSEMTNAFKKSPSLILDHTFKSKFDLITVEKVNW